MEKIVQVDRDFWKAYAIIFNRIINEGHKSPEFVEGGIEAETRQALLNLQNILDAAGSGLKNVLKTTVYLNDINEFGKMNSVYGEFFVDDPPARAAIQAAALPKGAAVQIEAVAVISQV